MEQEDKSMVPRAFSIRLTVVASVPCKALTNKHTFLSNLLNSLFKECVHALLSSSKGPPTHFPFSTSISSSSFKSYKSLPQDSLSWHLQIKLGSLLTCFKTPYTLLLNFKRLLHTLAKNKVPNSRFWGTLKALKKYLFNKQT